MARQAVAAASGRPAVSVLIPTLDEALTLPLLLGDLTRQRGLVLEIIVADGGSRDATVELAKGFGAHCLASHRGRGAQLNAAAAAARAPWLLCLHADSRLPNERQIAQALATLRKARLSQPLVAGHWPLRFTRSDTGHDWLFRQLEAKTASNRPGTIHGDQGFFLHRDALTALGGFDQTLPFFEDFRLAAAISACGAWLLLPGALETSARRFEREGHAARLALMALMVGAEAAGLDDWLADLPQLYRAQGETESLHLAPFLRSLSERLRALPSTRRRVLRDAVGRLLTGNAWQLALALDTLRADATARWLPRFDRWLAPHADRPPLPALAGEAMLLAIHCAARWSKPA